MWLTIGQWVAVAVLGGWALYVLRSMVQGDRRTVGLIQLVHVAFCGVPLLLDLVIGSPAYSYHVGYIAASANQTTTWIYLGYILLVPIIFKVAGGKAQAGGVPSNTDVMEGGFGELVLGPHSRRAAAVTIVLFVLVVLATDPLGYLRYATALDTTFTAKPGYLVVSGLSALAALGCVLLLTERTIHPSTRFAIVPLLFVAMWIQGKRSVVALTVFAVFFASWKSGRIRGKAILAAAACAALAIGGFSAFYQSEIRSTDAGARLEELSQSPNYVYFRVDYGRDAGIRQAIHAEVDPDTRPVLDYRGQSLVFLAGVAIPRALWPSKPFPYPVYSTARALGIETREIGWGITTSWLEEAIANFSWLGFLIGPVVPALICNLGDRRKGAAASLLTVVVASLLLAVNVGAFLPMVILWLVSLIERPRPDTGSRMRLRRDLSADVHDLTVESHSTSLH
jgi:hypothetical protein